VLVRFVDIDGIADHHCLNFLVHRDHPLSITHDGIDISHG
jgi:hypothetical protein